MAMTPAERIKRYRERRYAEIEQMEKIPCECGCGTLIPPLNRLLQPAKYAVGHASKGNEVPALKGHKAWNKGKKLSPESIAKRQETRRAKNGGIYQVKRGWKHTEATIHNMSESKKGLYVGEKNPFYGKRHTQETKEKLSQMLSRENNPGWKGSASLLPYGKEFTRKLRRLIRERDNYTCQRCGATQGDKSRALPVHHIDHNKLNNSHDNLVTVCYGCNTWCSYHRDEPFVRLSERESGG